MRIRCMHCAGTDFLLVIYRDTGQTQLQCVNHEEHLVSETST